MTSGASRVLRALKERAARGFTCTTLAALAALTRLTPSELRDIVDELVARGLVAVSGNRVCYTGSLGLSEDTKPLLGREIRRALDKIKLRRDIIYYLGVVSGSLPFVDIVIARRDGVVFLVKAVKREHTERLTAIARRLARTARRVAEGREELPFRPLSIRVIVPVLVSGYGAPRLVEGVIFRPASRLVSLVLDPEPELAHPLVRVYVYQPSRSSS